ncbi:hypothetical protein [Niabella ginsengisoli]|uniref:Uncharacterized protein n=1 Tax=Niabella ginsengisoli TaxID=522298 RepID=A0ABS9SEV5_9BACT|nr:hypothetical protein [Niabella ginsengisoli]MCH5596891.1 hypothetical protein [Niabella ginsengisoli]
MLSTVKQELLNKISETEDEDLLKTLNEDFDYLKKATTVSSFFELSENDNQELMDMLNEPFGKDTESYDSFKAAIDKWRTR